MHVYLFKCRAKNSKQTSTSLDEKRKICILLKHACTFPNIFNESATFNSLGQDLRQRQLSRKIINNVDTAILNADCFFQLFQILEIGRRGQTMYNSAAGLGTCRTIQRCFWALHPKQVECRTRQDKVHDILSTHQLVFVQIPSSVI